MKRASRQRAFIGLTAVSGTSSTSAAHVLAVVPSPRWQTAQRCRRAEPARTASIVPSTGYAIARSAMEEQRDPSP
jgi:hypothetical protein